MMCPACGLTEITKQDISAIIQVYPRHTQLLIFAQCPKCGARYFTVANTISKSEMKHIFDNYSYNYWGRISLSAYEDRLPFGLTYHYNKMVETINSFKGGTYINRIDTMSLLP